MYLVRFSYEILPLNREEAVGFIRREVEAARSKGLKARLLVPITRGPGCAALQFEIELRNLDQLEEFRHHGVDAKQKTGDWMHGFSEILLSPPAVEILRAEE